MVAIRVDAFGGMVPAVDDRLLPDKAAAYSENAWLYSGRLVGMNAPKAIHTCASPTATRVFRIPNNYTDALHLGDADWLEFQNQDTDVVRAPVVGDTFDRYYWATTSDVPRYNTRARIKAGSPAWKLGINPPAAAPAVVPSGGVGTTVSRAYVYTWVSAYGEEGPPSPPVTVSGKVDGTWAVTVTAALAGDLGVDRNLTKTRIYRTVTSTAGVATFFFVAELAIATLTYSDVLLDAAVSATSQLPSTTWTPPPTDIVGWVAMPNGMIAGWRKNEVWFCEPYRPHAWPALYALAVDFPVVGLGVIGQTLVVCTQGPPITMTGVNPGSISQSKLAFMEPCQSRGGIVSTPEGVYYPSPNGLILVNPGVAVNTTRELMTKDRWQALARVSTLYAARLGQAYYAFGSARQGVFDSGAFDNSAFTQQDAAGSFSGVLIDAVDKRVAFNVLTNTLPASTVMNDPWSGELFVVRNGVVYWVDIADAVPVSEVLTWRSKIFQTSDKKNLGAMRVYFTVPATAPALNPTRNTNLVQTLAADQWGLVRVYANNVLVTTRELRTSGELMRITSGFKADYWQFEFQARVTIFSMQAAATVKELVRV